MISSDLQNGEDGHSIALSSKSLLHSLISEKDLASSLEKSTIVWVSNDIKLSIIFSSKLLLSSSEASTYCSKSKSAISVFVGNDKFFSSTSSLSSTAFVSQFRISIFPSASLISMVGTSDPVVLATTGRLMGSFLTDGMGKSTDCECRPW